jgi:hypothetical protein
MALLVGGVVAIIALGVLLLANKASYTVGVIFVLVGALISYLQIFLPFPFIPLRRDPAAAAAPAAAGPSGQGQPDAGPGRMAQRPERPTVPSRVHGTALLLAAPLLFATSFIGLEDSPSSTSAIDLTYHLLALATGILIPLGVVAFNAPHAGAARKLGVVATVIIVTNWITGDLGQFFYIVNFSPGARVPEFVFTIFKDDAIVAIAANIFLAAAISLGRFYPQWIPWLCLANAAAEAFYVFMPHNKAALPINNVGGLVLACAYAVIGYYLLSRVPGLRPAAQSS